MTQPLHFIIPPEHAGRRFDQSLAELLPDYSDIALIVADLGDGGELMSYVLHFDVSEEWKIYYAESKDLTLIKGFINDEMLQSIGIFTITDSEAEDYLN